MKKDKLVSNQDPSTEEKIKNAARKVFYQKGFAATRTRDIAQEAGINLALLNYYFRSKQKLFDIIMLETIQGFFQSMRAVFNDPQTSLEKKIEILVDRYIDLLVHEPEIPLFIMSEIRTDPQALVEKMDIKNILLNSYLVKQYEEAAGTGKVASQNLLHFLMNLIGLMVFPFIASPLIKIIGAVDDEKFNELMEERKKLIPIWIGAMFKKT
jgi:AcrR family transcriptional regulator